MGAAGRERAEEFSWERVTAKVDDFYGLVIRRLAARGELPASFHAAIPPSPRAAQGLGAMAVGPGLTGVAGLGEVGEVGEGGEGEPEQPEPVAIVPD
jgi:hypothetical protein